ncbi:MAG: peptide/nickel transport system substrate-binding protein [Solirubrobacteraceae bacterium]|nr:peptide/nickel transport system substrate-binding protein [Solirubrobacteraceae bacterium]
MRKVRLSGLLLGLLALVALVAAGCGGSSNNESSSSSGSKGQNTAPVQGKQGGKLTYLAAADVDYIDPGQTYYTFGYQVLYATNRPLYSFAPGDTSKPHADLAEGDPQISADKKTITVKIKPNIKYGPPVNRVVKTADIKYAFERAFSANVPSGYATSYFADIVGAPTKPTNGVKPISGITTPDATTIVFKLTKATAVTVAAALVMPISVPIPEEYAKKYDAKSPSEYDQYAVSTGPYMVANNAQGKLTGRDPGKKIDLVRNPNWDKSTDFRPAYLDEIVIEEGNDDLTVASRRTLSGQALICCDSGQPPIPILAKALRSNKDQLGRVSGGGTRWIALNTTKKPFDNINIRKAVIAGFDRNALRLTRGGANIGPIAQGFIPPGIPGFEESGGTKGFTDIDYMQNPAGDPTVMKKYLDLAAKDGVKPGDGGDLLTIATNADPGNQTAQVAQGQFQKMGFKLNYRKVPQDTLYTKFCGVPKSNYVICPNVGWFKDFTDPQSMLEPTFKGAAIKPQGNVNWSLLNDKSIDDAMTKDSVIPAGPERNKAWAAINKQIIEQAVAIPYVWDDNVNLWSKNVQSVMNAYYAGPDLNYTFLK